MISEEYFIRRPVLDIETINKIYDTTNINTLLNQYIQKNHIKERLMVGSLSLFNELERVNFDSEKLSSSARNTLIKYLLRMASRTMPFGLFSGISNHTFTKVNESFVEKEIKSIRISPEWYLELIKKIEQNQQENSILYVRLNPAIFEKNNTLLIDRIKQNKHQRITLSKTEFVQEIKKYAKSFIMIKDLIIQLDPFYNQPAQILKEIKILLDNEILISELRPNVYDAKQLLEKLLNKYLIIPKTLHEQLEEILMDINEYENLTIGEGIESYISIIKKMEILVKSKSYLIIDNFLPTVSETAISKNKVMQLNEDIQFLSFLNYLRPEFEAFIQYEQKFLNKYGMYYEVPLQEVLDNKIGLGLPNYSNFFNADIDRANKEIEDFILRKIIKSIQNNNMTIHLTENDINFLKSKYHKNLENNINGFDFKVTKIEGEDTLYTITNNAFGNVKGAFTGRFNLPQQHTRGLYYSNENYISAEINAVPNNYFSIGITHIPVMYRINVNTGNDDGHSIELNDLVLGIDGEGMYLKSIKFNKKVIPISTHMLNYALFDENEALLFLYLFQKYKAQTPQDFILRQHFKLNYLPRIQFKDIILSFERWNIFNEEVEIWCESKNSTKEEFVKDFLKTTCLPKYVYHVEGDKQLPINTQSDIGIKLLIEAVTKLKKNSNPLILTEAPEFENIENKTNQFIQDYIFSKEIQQGKSRKSDKSNLKYAFNNLYDLDWVYYNVYPEKNYSERTLHEILEFLTSKKCTFFFINYKDEKGEHIRIRFKNKLNIEQDFSQFLFTMIQKEWIVDFSKHLFQPEIERYGGENTYLLAYNYFCEDSSLYLKIMQENLFKGLGGLEVGVILTTWFLLDFFDNYEDAKSFMEKIVKTDAEITQKFKKNRSEYVDLMKKAINSYKEQKKLSTKNKISLEIQKNIINHNPNRCNYILLSILHMTINRYCGIDRGLENKVFNMVKNAFHNLKYELEMKGGYKDVL